LDLQCQSLKKQFDNLKQSINNCPKTNQSKLQRLKEEKDEILLAAEALWQQIANDTRVTSAVATGSTSAVTTGSTSAVATGSTSALTADDVSQIVVKMWEQMQHTRVAAPPLAIADGTCEARSPDCNELILELEQSAFFGFKWQHQFSMRRNVAVFMAEHRHEVVCELKRDGTIHRMIFP
jgi:hypothetical protein